MAVPPPRARGPNSLTLITLLSAIPPRRDIESGFVASSRILCLCAHGGLTGVPQVNIPGAEVGGLPVGLSIVGGPGTDATLVAVAAAITRM